MFRNWLRPFSQAFGTSSRRTRAVGSTKSKLARPRFIRLEDRITPTVTSSLVGSTANVVSDAAADAINITEAAGFLLLNGNFDWNTGLLGIQFLAATTS